MKKRDFKSITNKVLRVLHPKRGVNPHKLNPEEYYKRYWFNKPDSELTDFITRAEQCSDKEANHLLHQWGAKYFISQKVLKHIEESKSPEDTIEQALRTRRIWFWNLYCRRHGVDPTAFNF